MVKDEQRTPICEKVRESLSAYLDGELGGRARRAVEEHLDRCKGCRQYLRELKETWDLLDELEAPIVRRGSAGRIVGYVREEARVGPVRRLLRSPRLRRMVSGVAASVAAAVFLFGIFVSSRPLGDVPTPAERECILYLDFLKDLETLEHMDQVEQIQELGHELEETQGPSRREGAGA